MNLIRFFMALGAIAISLVAGTLSAATNLLTATQWVPADLVFNCPAPVGAEFEVEFSATFAGPDAASLKVPGFYDGGDHFVIRFAPPAPGKWTYSTVSSLAKLNNQQGEVNAIAAPSRQRGPVSLNPTTTTPNRVSSRSPGTIPIPIFHPQHRVFSASRPGHHSPRRTRNHRPFDDLCLE